MLQPYISDHDSKSSKVNADDVDYKLYVFVIQCKQKFTASQTIKVEFELVGVIPNDINGYALVLTNKLISKSSNGRRDFDLILVQGFHNIPFSFHR